MNASTKQPESEAINWDERGGWRFTYWPEGEPDQAYISPIFEGTRRDTDERFRNWLDERYGEQAVFDFSAEIISDYTHAECQACGWAGLIEICDPREIPDLANRLDPGGTVPVNTCPAPCEESSDGTCGALVYAVTSNKSTACELRKQHTPAPPHICEALEVAAESRGPSDSEIATQPEKHTILVIMEGGLIQEVAFPSAIKGTVSVAVHDYDTDGCMGELHKDRNGEEHTIETWD